MLTNNITILATQQRTDDDRDERVHSRRGTR